jgi:protein-L-isoaspartate(D-aspartate) O-methyltransferase
LAIFSDSRQKLVQALWEDRIIKTRAVRDAMLAVPREEFIPERLRPSAYDDSPLPSLDGQTISAPHMVAIMCEVLELKPGMAVLEVGAGTGYHAAVCSEMVAPEGAVAAGHVYAVERVASLAEFARGNVSRCGYSGRVTVIEGDGTMGYPPAAPYDRILVTAAAPAVPPPLKMQLKDGGLLVIPVGEVYSVQTLLRLRRSGDSFTEQACGCCVFVPLRGQYGWNT